jgi:hypothetical protein
MIDFEILNKFNDKNWDWKALSSNESLKIEKEILINSLLEKPWDWKILSNNAAISKLIDDEKIPYMRIIELENFFIMRMDRCCPCDCNDRYQVKKIKKEEIDEFINTQLKGCVKVCDYYFTPTDSV